MASLSPTSVEAPAPLRVYDLADPHRHGTIIKAGPEVSEVRFDDGPERNVVNAHLRPVGTSVDEELTRSTHPEEAVLHRGREAWNRLRTNSTWEDWKAVSNATADDGGCGKPADPNSDGSHQFHASAPCALDRARVCRRGWGAKIRPRRENRAGGSHWPGSGPRDW